MRCGFTARSAPARSSLAIEDSLRARAMMTRSARRVRADVTLDEGLQQGAQRVERGPDADEDEDDREDLAPRAERPDLPETDRGDGGDRLVQRVEQAEAEHPVARRAHRQHDGERQQG